MPYFAALGESREADHLLPPAWHHRLLDSARLFADYRPSYRQQPAQDGWKRTLDWFGAHGVKWPPLVG